MIIIGTNAYADINEYNNSIKKDKALNRRFETILINEPIKKEKGHLIRWPSN